ncbi:SDR family NAD(P)-dependent oxidoreductase, partial [Bradyrhizobium sp. SZCCHNS1012]|uniref:SDR family NAD(P)-dependent oxidoreductase n=1 Tax=Bradyrhizobium sp. SZCCHNS1012 TaxID=3057297 RepID=UPI002915F142
LDLHIALDPESDDAIRYEIYSGAGDAAVVHSQGRAVLAASEPVAVVDLQKLREQCDEPSASAEDCYAAFSQMGLAYGGSFRCLRHVRKGRDATGRPLALGELSLAPEMADASYVLHPGLLDAALQASIGLALGSEVPEDRKPPLPFALERLEILAPLPEKAWAIVQDSRGGERGSAVEKLDIDVADESGRVCLHLGGYSYRVPDSSMRQKPVMTSRPLALVGELTLSPSWEVVDPLLGAIWPAADQRLVILGGTEVQQQALERLYPQAQMLSLGASDSVEQLTQALGKVSALDHVLWLLPSAVLAGEALVAAQTEGALSGFRLIKALLALGYGGKALGLTVVTEQAQLVTAADRVQPAHASVHGLIGSLAKEYVHWKIRLVDMPATADWPMAELFTLPADKNGNALAYRNGQWYRQHLLNCMLSAASVPSYRSGGVYVVIGGAGGLGEVFTEYLLRQYQAQVIWIGRREEDTTIAAKRNRLGALGPKPHYIAADATNRLSLQAAYKEIKERFGAIHGLVHAAIVLKDQSLARMEEAVFSASLAAKVDASVYMADVFRSEALDFVLFFSSLQSQTKAPGQSNYAAGCTFADAFAQLLRQHWSCSVKVVNWGYWGSVGVAAADKYRVRMDRIGLASIEPPEAMAVLERLLASPLHQVIFVKTTTADVASWLGVGQQIIVAQNDVVVRQNQATASPPAVQAKPASVQAAPLTEADDDRTLRTKLENALARCVSEIVKIKREEIDVDVKLTEFGFDSIMVSGFANVLNERYGLELNPTIFFEYPTIEALASYLACEHRTILANQFSVSAKPVAMSTATDASHNDTPIEPLSRRRRTRFRQVAAVTAAPSASEPIAVIALSGRYPGADTLEEYWSNLRQGVDSIREIPPERWDH